MTIIATTLAPLGGDAWSLSWTGTADRDVRVFVNGLLVYGPVLFDTAAKSVDVGLPSPATIEVHENPAGETVPAAGIELERRPLIWWQTVPGAAVYRIYLDDELKGVVLNEPSRLHHEYVLLTDVRVDGGASWRGLRVEAVSADDVETVTAPVPIFVPGLTLTEPSDVDIAGSAGVFNITVTP